MSPSTTPATSAEQRTEPPHDLTALIAAVRARAEGVGYQVAETSDGFRVERDLADTRYWGPLYRAGVHTLTGHQVTADAATGVLAITDVHRNVEWRAGDDGATQPFWSLHAETSRGRISAVGTKRSWGVREDGTLGSIEDYSFDTDQGRAVIRDVAAELGWREQMPLDQRIGLVVAVATLVGLVLCFGGWGLVALLG